MKLQKAPLILLAIALVLGAFVYFYEVQGKSQREVAQAQTEQLFSFKEDEVRSLTLTTPTQAFSFAKIPSAPAPAGVDPKTSANTLVWTMTAPDQALANDASVAYLLNLMATGKRQQTLTVAAARQAEFGFDQPLAIVEVKLADQTTHSLRLGKPNFNRSALYAQVDLPTQANAAQKTDQTIVLVSTDFENAVKRPLPDWKEKEPTAGKQPDAKPKK